MQNLEVEARFNSVFGEYGKFLRNAIASYCPARTGLHVDDIMQEACVRLWRALSGGKEIYDYPSYLHRVAATTTIDAVRRVKARREEQAQFPAEFTGEPDGGPQLTDLPDPQASPEEATNLHMLMEMVKTAVGRLPENRRRAVSLHLQGLNTLEIAGLIGWSEPKVRNLVYRGLAELRAELRALGCDCEIE